MARFSLTLALALMAPLLIWPVRVSLWTFIQRLGIVAQAEKGAAMPSCQFICLSYAILLITTTAAAVLDNLGVVFGVLGSVGGSTLFYIYPAAAFMALVRRSREQQVVGGSGGSGGGGKVVVHKQVVSEGSYVRWMALAWALLVYGVGVLCVGCVATFSG